MPYSDTLHDTAEDLRSPLGWPQVLSALSNALMWHFLHLLDQVANSSKPPGEMRARFLQDEKPALGKLRDLHSSSKSQCAGCPRAAARLGDAVVRGDGLRHRVLPHEQAVPGRPVARVPAPCRLARRLETLPATTLYIGQRALDCADAQH